MIGKVSALVLALAALMTATSLRAAPPKIDYLRDIRPLLAAHCYACHGPDKREGGLRLDTRDGALAESDSGSPSIVPGKPDESELLARLVESDAELRMPQKGEPLKKAEIELLRRWIADGATFTEHWADVRPQQPQLPSVKRADWPAQRLDYFTLHRMEEAGLAPNEEADRYTLIRRVYLDLIGLTPSVQEVDAFVADTHPDAYQRMVDRLLASPRYGERWARWWLDLARYADSNGYESDEPRTMWPYRDWVIEALNRNLPFDQFSIEQLAGDLLLRPTDRQLIATGFHRNTLINTEGGTKNDEFKDAAIKDRIETTFTVWLGVTFNCAQCHNHKYDPFSQRDYYGIYAIFNNTTDKAIGGETDKFEKFTGDYKIRAKFQAEVERLEKLMETEKDEEKLDDLEVELVTAEEELDLYESDHKITTMIMKEGPVRPTHIQKRGDFLQPAERVEPGLPTVFDTSIVGNGPIDRLAMAQWLMHPEHPRTARVTVNRIWDVIFGQPLVATSEDFGSQGDLPTHPQLLDHLAVEFVASGWDMKQLLRLIVTSATYRQSSRATPEKLQTDRYNRLLSRGARFRMEAEMIRDVSLSAAGMLSKKIGGPSVFPPQPDSIWENLFIESGHKIWPESEGEDRYRRGLYTFLKRTALHPMLRSFDAPTRSVCTVRRRRSNTPLSALVSWNAPEFVEAAGGLAMRMSHASGDVQTRATYGFRLCVARPPSPQQQKAIVSLYETALARFQADPTAAEELIENAFFDPPTQVNNAELAAWILVANTLLNMDATLTKG